MQKKNKYYTKIDGHWVHRSPIKLLANPLLRKLQFFTDKPFVIASETEFVDTVPQFIKYKMVRVPYNK
jgi:hypothetical protein